MTERYCRRRAKTLDGGSFGMIVAVRQRMDLYSLLVAAGAGCADALILARFCAVGFVNQRRCRPVFVVKFSHIDATSCNKTLQGGGKKIHQLDQS